MGHQINIGSILSKVDAWKESSEGMQIMGMASVGVIEPEMEEAASKMIAILNSNASGFGLPPSVLAHFQSLSSTPPAISIQNNGRVCGEINISFGDDMSRPSLLIVTGKRAGEHTGEGIDNIVSLFNTGYNASRGVYGLWESRGNTVRSMSSRLGGHFLESAVDEFNSLYGARYHAIASLC